MTIPFWLYVIIAFILLFDLAVFLYAVLNSQPLIRSRANSYQPSVRAKNSDTKIKAFKILLLPLFIVIGLPFIIFYLIPCLGVGIIYTKIKTHFTSNAR